MDRLDQISDGALLLFRLLKRLLQGNPDDPARVPFRNQSYQILKVLERHGPLPMSVLGKQLVVAKQNMTTLTDALMRKGLVERRKDESDRRIVRIVITPRGERFLEDSRTALKQIIRQNLAELSPQDVRALDTAFQTIRTVVSKLEQNEPHITTGAPTIRSRESA